MIKLYKTHMTATINSKSVRAKLRIPYWLVLSAFSLVSMVVVYKVGKIPMEMTEYVSPVRAEVTPIETPKEITKEQTVKVICHSAYNDLYREKMDSYNVGFGLYMDTCYRDLIAIATEETHLDCSKVGDGGRSFGCYQIHRGYHPEITVEQATDFGFATAWTLGRLVEHGWPKYRKYSVMKHNGSNDRARAYAERVLRLADSLPSML